METGRVLLFKKQAPQRLWGLNGYGVLTSEADNETFGFGNMEEHSARQCEVLSLLIICTLMCRLVSNDTSSGCRKLGIV
jgi:hypothetical protein